MQHESERNKGGRKVGTDGDEIVPDLFENVCPGPRPLVGLGGVTQRSEDRREMPVQPFGYEETGFVLELHIWNAQLNCRDKELLLFIIGTVG